MTETKMGNDEDGGDERNATRMNETLVKDP